MKSEKPHILIFSTAYYPFFSGAEVAVKEISNRIKDKEFHLITARMKFGLPNKEKMDNITVYRIGLGLKIDKFLLPIFGLPIALKLHSQYNYQIAWSLMASQASLLAVRFIKKIKIKFLTTLQEGDEEDYLKRYVFGNNFLYKYLILPLHRQAIRRAHHIQTISQYLKDRALKAGAQCPITVIPNGVNFNIFTPADPLAVKQLKSEHGIKADKTVIITHGRMAEKNAFADIIKAMQFLPEKFVFVCIGQGEQKNMLHDLVKNLNLSSRIFLVDKEYIQQEKIAPYLSLGDIYCRPSLSEGLGNSMLEAMAFRIPVITTPVGGIVDFIKDGQTGLFCEINNPESIAEKIMQVSEDQNLYNTLSNNAYHMVHTSYSWNSISKKINDIFNSLLND